MIAEEQVIVLDIDGTLCKKKPSGKSYSEVLPDENVVKKILEYKNKNFYIILYTSRQMRTYKGNIGKINANTAKILLDWLQNHNIPYDEIHFGKPWCGKDGFYVDDKAIRPSEFLELSYQKILELLKEEERR